jgi:hypothetical protein
MAFLEGSLSRKLGFCAHSGKSGSGRAIRPRNSGFDRHKTPKRSLAGLSKAHRHWYIPLAPSGFGQGLPSQEAFGRNRRLKALAKPFRFLKPKAKQRFIAGWSSPVARQAHNLKVTGSNPVPATRQGAEESALNRKAAFRGGFSFLRIATGSPPHLQSRATSGHSTRAEMVFPVLQVAMLVANLRPQQNSVDDPGDAKRRMLVPCICNSGRPAAERCWTSRGLHKTGLTGKHTWRRPADVTPRFPANTGQRGRPQDPAEKQVELSGMPWLKGWKKMLGFAALTAKLSLHPA